jgi:hypothetical protein
VRRLPAAILDRDGKRSALERLAAAGIDLSMFEVPDE